jgi:hypothetical protein
MFWFILFFYILPAIISYLGIKEFYKDKKYISPSLIDVAFVVLPFMNIGASMVYIFDLDLFKVDFTFKNKIEKLCRKFFGL